MTVAIKHLLESVSRHGVRISVGPTSKLRLAPPGRLPEPLKIELTRHSDEVVALLSPATDIVDPSALIATTFGEVDTWYVAGALALLDEDSELRERFNVTERAIDLAALDADLEGLRSALAAHVAVIREALSGAGGARSPAAPAKGRQP